MDNQRRFNVGIYIYENAEVLDFSGPFEVFSTASRLSDPVGVFRVFLIAEENHRISARGNYNVCPHHAIDQHPDIDVLIVAGGVHTEQLNKAAVLHWLKSVSEQATIVASVCTGAFILAQAGLLTNRTVTTHWEDIDDLRLSYPELTVVEHQRWVDEGKFVTSGGISAGIDMSLHLVSRLVDLELAQKTARQMEFDWRR